MAHFFVGVVFGDLPSFSPVHFFESVALQVIVVFLLELSNAFPIRPPGSIQKTQRVKNSNPFGTHQQNGPTFSCRAWVMSMNDDIDLDIIE